MREIKENAMKCKKCGYTTDNKKSFSNHMRYGCKANQWTQNKTCEYCGSLISRKKPKEQGRFCNHTCYGLWRSENCLGTKAPSYKDGRCKERLLERARLPFKRWRKAVFQKDNYTCKKCGDNQGGNLEAHHIKSFALHPELRYDVNNGLTLCKKCHKETDNYGYTKKNNKV
jgi:5-methylcytosine-specific restriction endonuclease McrA